MMNLNSLLYTKQLLILYFIPGIQDNALFIDLSFACNGNGKFSATTIPLVYIPLVSG